MKYIKLLGAGLLISWLGALPLGTLNVTAFDIAATQGFNAALLFAFAAILIELFYVRLSLYGSKKWVLNEQWIPPLLILGSLLLGYLAISNFFASGTIEAQGSKIGLLPSIGSPVLLGFLLSALNPLQFPFWLTWNKVLGRKGLLQDDAPSYSFYMLGIGLGTFLALLLFIWMGQNLITDYQVYAQYSGKILGAIYLGFSFYLLYLFYTKNLKPIRK